MKADIGPLEIDLPAQVTFFDFDHGTPIYHAPAEDFETEKDDQGETIRWRVKTRCGETTYGEVTDHEGAVHVQGPRGTTLPARFAIKIGRPCASCWPILRSRPSLFGRRRPGLEQTPRPAQEPLS
jgi:hypothetical protein